MPFIQAEQIIQSKGELKAANLISDVVLAERSEVSKAYSLVRPHKKTVDLQRNK